MRTSIKSVRGPSLGASVLLGPTLGAPIFLEYVRGRVAAISIASASLSASTVPFAPMSLEDTLIGDSYPVAAAGPGRGAPSAVTAPCPAPLHLDLALVGQPPSFQIDGGISVLFSAPIRLKHVCTQCRQAPPWIDDSTLHPHARRYPTWSEVASSPSLSPQRCGQPAGWSPPQLGGVEFDGGGFPSLRLCGLKS